jgi:hypothetical protein
VASALSFYAEVVLGASWRALAIAAVIPALLSLAVRDTDESAGAFVIETLLIPGAVTADAATTVRSTFLAFAVWLAFWVADTIDAILIGPALPTTATASIISTVLLRTIGLTNTRSINAGILGTRALTTGTFTPIISALFLGTVWLACSWHTMVVHTFIPIQASATRPAASIIPAAFPFTDREGAGAFQALRSAGITSPAGKPRQCPRAALEILTRLGDAIPIATGYVAVQLVCGVLHGHVTNRPIDIHLDGEGGGSQLNGSTDPYNVVAVSNGFDPFGHVLEHLFEAGGIICQGEVVGLRSKFFQLLLSVVALDADTENVEGAGILGILLGVECLLAQFILGSGLMGAVRQDHDRPLDQIEVCSDVHYLFQGLHVGTIEVCGPQALTGPQFFQLVVQGGGIIREAEYKLGCVGTPEN